MKKSIDITDFVFLLFIGCMCIAMVTVAFIGVKEYMDKNIEEAICIDGKLYNKIPERDDIYIVIEGYVCREVKDEK